MAASLGGHIWSGDAPTQGNPKAFDRPGRGLAL
jgi:hypothetical protein